LEIVRRGLEQSHCITAFVRSPERLKVFQDQISIKQGDLLSSSELEKVILSQDAVVSGFALRVPISKTDANLLQHFAVALTRAMQPTGVRRLVVESGALFRDSIMPPRYLFGRLFYFLM
jgi:putative NADH-flavin reductase